MSSTVRLVSVIHGPAYGGAHNQALVLAEPLRSLGVETEVLLPREAAAAAARLEAGGVPTERIELGRLRASADPRLQLRLARRLRGDVRALAERLDAARANVVQVHGPTNPQGAWAARRAQRRPAVVWQLLDTRAPSLLRRLAMPLVVRSADSITAWGEALLDGHPGARRLGERAFVVYPPVRQELLAPSAGRREAAREELGIAADELLVLSVGVLNPQKGHEYLLEAVARVRARHPRVRVRILGADSPAHAAYRRDLEQICAGERIADPEALVDPGSRVADLIQAADVFALASVARSEGMPTAILEAMAAGKPVVASRVGAVAELVADGLTGVLVDPGDAAGLASAVATLAADPARREQMAATGFETARSRFGLPALAERHAAAYRTALARRDARTG